MHRGLHPDEEHHREQRRLGTRLEGLTRQLRSGYWTKECSIHTISPSTPPHAPFRDLQGPSWPTFGRVPHDFGEHSSTKHRLCSNFDRVFADRLKQFRGGMHFVQLRRCG